MDKTYDKVRRAIGESDRQLVDDDGNDDRLAASDLHLSDMEPSHRDQRVTAADLAAVRAQELADFASHRVTVSEPVHVRDLPSLPNTQATHLDWIFEQDSDEYLVELEAQVDHYTEQAAAGQDARRIVRELRELLSAKNDGPEGPMSPSWILGQVCQILGLREESLDLSKSGFWGRAAARAMRERNVAMNLAAKVRDLLSSDGDTSLILGEARRILGIGIRSEHDAETLDLTTDLFGGES